VCLLVCLLVSLFVCLCVVGVDALHGREGGTWFGVSAKFAKIRALLNISQVTLDTSKHPRGHFVPEYLQSDLDAAAYINTLEHQRSQFNPFNLLLLQRRFVHCCCHCKYNFMQVMFLCKKLSPRQ